MFLNHATTRRSNGEIDKYQGYLAHKKPPPPRTLQEDYALGPLGALGGGRLLKSEVPLYVQLERELFREVAATNIHRPIW